MKKKYQKIQLILVSIGAILIVLTYFYYPYTKRDKVLNNPSVQEEKLETFQDEQSQAFADVEYKGLYTNKPFIIQSKKAYIQKESDWVNMENMNMILYLNDGRIVHITSNKGKYNRVSHDAFFEGDVVANDGETEITSENLDLLATKNILEIRNNVVLNYPTGSLRADKIDYDFETKYLKVSMFDDENIKMKVIK